MTKRMTLENSVSEFSITHNLGMKTVEEKSSNPVLTKAHGKEYRYILSKVIGYEELGIPYQFIIATLKHFIRNEDAYKNEVEEGNCKRIFLLSKSEEKEYSLSLQIEIKNYLINIFSVRKFSLSKFDDRVKLTNSSIRKVYLEDLDIDTYLQKMKEMKKQWRKKIANKHPSFWTNESSGLTYRVSYTRHLTEERSGTSEKRLTMPVGVVKDILRYTMETSAPILKKYMGISKKEKQVLIVVPSLNKTYNIGILVAINDILFTVISMYDVPPEKKSRGIETLMFPKTKRIVLPGYDLGTYMKIYKEQLKTQEKRRKMKLKQKIEEARRKSGIKVVSSFNDYFTPRIKKASLKPRIKIRKVEVTRPDISDTRKRVTGENKIQSSNDVKLQLSKKATFYDAVKIFFKKLFAQKH